MATITITDELSHIIFTDSAGTGLEVSVPKRNLTILKRTNDGDDTEYVYLNWPAGGQSGGHIWHRDDYKLKYTDVTSPSLASNAALVALLQEYAGSIASSGGAGGAGGGSIVYTNAAGDFTATPGDGDKTITIAGLPFTLEAIHVVGGSIKRIDTNDEVTNVKLTDVAVSSGVITLSDEDNFALTDTLYVTLIGPDKWYDRNLDNAKTNTQNPDYEHYTNPQTLVSASDVGDEFANWTDQGPEIPCDSYNELCLFVDFTVNDSTLATMRVLAKHESGGSEEYVMDDFAEISLGDSNLSRCYKVPIDHVTPYVQVQTKTGYAEQGGTTTTTTTVGHTNGTVGIVYTLGYK
jgi:hypothetical protein